MKRLGLMVLLLGLSCQVFAAEPVGAYSKEMKAAEDAFNREDVVNAIQILEKLAKNGHMPAQVRLGELLDYSEQDAEAVKWYGKAAERGDPTALYKLGVMYVNGEGVTVNLPHAVKLIKMSAERNHVAAARALFHAYRDGSMGLAVDLEQSRYWQSKMNALDAAAKTKR